jgi:hypothetical protein
MDSPRAYVAAGVIGFLLGGACGVGVVLLHDDDRPAESSTTVSSTSTTAPDTWVSEFETRLGPAALFPISLEVEGTELVVVYDMLPLTPRQPEAELVNDGGLAAPSRFTMAWAGGEVTTRVVAPSNRAARFEVAEGFGVADIESIRVDGYWVAAPIDLGVAYDPTGAEWSRIAPGVEARISTVLDQPDNYIVKVEYRGEALATDLFVVGDDREWARLSGSMIGRPVWTLDYRGEQLPDPFVLNTVGVVWVEVEGGGPVDISGVLQ